MGLPFTVSSSDAQQIQTDAADILANLPDWGGVISWHGRFILAFNSYGGWRFTDISGGYPVGNGAVISPQQLLSNMPTVQSSSFGVFMYSLPGNIADVAVERYNQLIAMGQTIAHDVGAIAGSAIAPTLEGLPLWPIAIIGAVILFAMYGPKTKSYFK